MAVDHWTYQKISDVFALLHLDDRHAAFLAAFASVHESTFWIVFRTRQEVFGVSNAWNERADQSPGTPVTVSYLFLFSIIISLISLFGKLESNVIVYCSRRAYSFQSFHGLTNEGSYPRGKVYPDRLYRRVIAS